MNRIDSIEELKRRLGIVAVINGEGIGLEQKGKRFLACCPFHVEKTPSFTVDPKKGLYKCFGCHKGGDAIRFIEEYQGLKFNEAIEHLGRKYSSVRDLTNIILGTRNSDYPDTDEPESEKIPKERKERREKVTFNPTSERVPDLLAALRNIHQYYQEQLSNTRGEEAKIARAYLESRGITQEIQRRFGIGFAPRNDVYMHDLAMKLNQERISKFRIDGAIEPGWEGIIEADRRGIIESDGDRVIEADWKEAIELMSIGGMLSDKRDSIFQGRLIFPVTTLSGEIVGFVGRVYKPSKAGKYKNSTESLVYNKSYYLMGLGELDVEQAKQNGVSLVEGVTDLIPFVEQGSRNALAIGTTRLNMHHLAILARLGITQFRIMTDGDRAGILGAITNANTVASVQLGKKKSHFFYPNSQTRELSVQITPLPEREDPFDLFYTKREPVVPYIRERTLSPKEFIIQNLPLLFGKDVEERQREEAKRSLAEHTTNLMPLPKLNSYLEQYGYQIEKQPKSKIVITGEKIPENIEARYDFITRPR